MRGAPLGAWWREVVGRILVPTDMANSFIVFLHVFDFLPEEPLAIVRFGVMAASSADMSLSLRFTSVRRCAMLRMFCNDGKRARPPTRSETEIGKPDICGFFPRRCAPALVQLAVAQCRCRYLRARRCPSGEEPRQSCSIPEDDRTSASYCTIKGLAALGGISAGVLECPEAVRSSHSWWLSRRQVAASVCSIWC